MMAFLPENAFPVVWALGLDPMICFGLILFSAVAMGELASRLRLPRISAYVATGVLLSFIKDLPALAGLQSTAHTVFELAFALILFELGQRIDLGWLSRNPWLLVTSMAESVLSFLAVCLLMLLFDLPPLLAVMIGTIATATGPAVVLGVCRDCTARGQLTDRLQLLAALSTCFSFVGFGLTYAWQHSEAASPLSTILFHPLYLVSGSVLLGTVSATAVLRLLTLIRPGSYSQTLAAVALIVITVALAKALDLSVVLSLLTAGVLSRSLDRLRRLQPMDFGLISRTALIVVFVATGTLFAPNQFFATVLPALGLLAARALAKSFGILIFARPSGLPFRKASLLSIGMLPMSGAALLWVERTATIWPELGAQLSGVVLTSLLIMEFLAPPALQFSLVHANETGDRV